MSLSPELMSFIKQNPGKKIVFTNGCFDILHVGHVKYLNEAKSLGDLLVIGLNSDSSVKMLKGENRPINHQDDRKYVLSSLKSVDFVEIFFEDTPKNIITELKPALYVKGGDWDITKIPEYKLVRAYGGEAKAITFIEGKSTTNLIRSVQGKA